MSEDCIFCKIVAGQLPCERVYEDEDIIAFADINPKAPTHVLVIPKKHIARVSHARPADEGLMGRLVLTANEVARIAGVAATGYRLVINCGEHGQQAVDHLHVHVLGGRQMNWPPG